MSDLENEGVLSLDIRELRYIIGIADARNMTKAASNLFVTQPALSKMLKKVEEQLGTQLFVRDGNSMTPTDAGLHVVERGKKIIHEFDELERQLADLKRMNRERVLLGIPPMIAALDFPEIIMKFRRHFPDVTVEVHEYGARKLESMVLDGTLDVAISMHPVASNDLSEIAIIQDQVVCAMNPDHPLTALERITLDDLSPYAINTFPVEYAVYEELIKKFKARKLLPHIDVTSPSCDFLLKISHLSNEVCVLPAPCVRHYGRDNMDVRPFEPNYNWSLCIVYRKNSYMSDRVRTLISCIEQVVNPPV